MKVAERMNQLVPSGIRKVNEKALAMERAGEKVIHFEIGRPDFDTPEYIKEAAIQAIRDGKVHYTSNFGLMELRQAIAEKLNRENNIPYKAEEILVTAGLSEAVMAVLEATLNPGDEILVPNPVWLNYINEFVFELNATGQNQALFAKYFGNPPFTNLEPQY